MKSSSFRSPCILMALLVVLTGCGRREKAGAPGLRVGLALPDASQPFYQAVRDGCRDFADEQGAELLLHDAGGELDEQSSGVSGLLSGEAPVVMVAPIDPERLSEPISLASSSEKYLVMLEREPQGESVSAVVRFNEDLAGRLAASYFDHRLQGSGRVVILNDLAPVGKDLVEAFRIDVMRGGREEVKTIQVRDEKDYAAAAQRVLAERPAAIFATGDAAALALVEAAEGVDPRPIIAAYGGSPEALQALDSNRGLDLVLARPARQLGSAAARIALRIAKNEGAPQELLLPVFPVTRENRRAYPGWDKPMPKEFTVPWPTSLKIKTERE